MDPTQEMIDAAHAAVKTTALPNGNYGVQLSKSIFDRFTLSGFTEMDFDGYAQKTATTWDSGTDILTGKRELTLLPPSGGLRYEAGANITEPQQCFGYRVVDLNNGNTPLGGKVFEQPVTFANPGDSLTLPSPQFTFRDDALEMPAAA
jgi:hypothetical protein